MERKQLKREIEREALARMEDSSRTVEDFKKVIAEYDRLDANRERRVRAHEVRRNEETIRLGYSDGLILPIPIVHSAWRGAINGEFLDLIFDNAADVWQLVEDWTVSKRLKALTMKQKDVVFLSAVRFCTPQQIACYRDVTDRAVRKLLTATLDGLREKIALDRSKDE